MRRATLDELACDPCGRYSAGGTYAHFCMHARLWGVVLWDRPVEHDVRALVVSLRLELDAGVAPHASIVDATRVTGVDAAAFGALDAYVRDNLQALARQVTRLALVRPVGLAGAVVAGFFEVLPRPYPVALFEQTAAALAWLEDDAPDETAARIASIHQQAAAIAPLVGALRALLAHNLRGLSVAQAARRLGVSERTLQRRLSEADTSFQAELGRARLEAAQRLMLDTDTPVTTIALEVGCATPQHFSALFKRSTGLSPSAWRSRHRRH